MDGTPIRISDCEGSQMATAAVAIHAAVFSPDFVAKQR